MRFACSAGVRGRRCAAFAISTVEHSVSTALSQATLPRLEGMAGQKFGRTRCPAKRGGLPVKPAGEISPACMAYILAMRRSSPEGDLNPSGAYGEKWGLPPKLLPQRQRNFAGHPDKCPAEALLGIKR